MTTVFLSGSRSLARIDAAARGRLDAMIARGLRIVIGDASGADKAMQRYLADRQYRAVTVFCAGAQCRNNLGAWTVRAIDADGARGRDFYAAKDRAMAAEADYGFVLWDGRSPGSLNNVRELVARRKSVVVFVAPASAFTTLSQPADLDRFLASHARGGRADPVAARA